MSNTNLVKLYGPEDPDLTLQNAIIAAYPEAALVLMREARNVYGRPCKPRGQLIIRYTVNGGTVKTAKQTFEKVVLE